jgi:precorrin-6A synthase
MRTILVIGIGTGNPEHMTMQAISALNRADAVLVPRKGENKSDLAEVRREICRRYLTDPDTRIVEFDMPARDAEAPYRNAVDDWHARIAEIWRALLLEHTAPDGVAALMVWGDPSLYDSTLRILARLRDAEALAFEIEVVPGITAMQALAASHAIPLNTVAGPVHITTGRRLRDEGVPAGTDSVVVMLDGGMAFRALAGEDYHIWWGAFLGTDDEIVIAGRLADVSERIAETREAARARKGWIMDTYLLRRVNRDASS